MDTGRLLKVIEDIQSDEKKFALQSKFQNVLNFYTQNNPDSLNKEKESLLTALRESRLSNYVLTDFKILDTLGVRGLFGDESYEALDAILDSQAHEVVKKLTEFTQKRQDAINRLAAAKSALQAFKLTPRELTDGQYEIGFSLPAEYQNLNDLESTLRDINQLLSEIASAVGESADFQITYVNNGSIEIFIHASFQLAHSFDILLDYALKMYAAAGMFRGIGKSIEHFEKKRRTAMEKAAKEEQKERSDALLSKMVEELGITNVEIQSRVKNLFIKFLEHFERGVSAEVRTPSLSEPEPPKADADPAEVARVEQIKEQYKEKRVIDDRNKEIFKLQSNNFDGLNTKFLKNGPDEVEESE